MAVPTKWKVVVFSQGKRWEKPVNGDPKRILEQIKPLSKNGAKVHLVSRVKAFRRRGLGERGQLWCPYCRRWRWFQERDVPLQGTERVVVRAVVCKWCWISTEDFHVKMYNHLWFETPKKKRRRYRRS